MDFGWEEIDKILSSLVTVIIFIVLNIFFRKQQEQKRRKTVVKSLLSEIDHNQKLMEAYSLQWQTKKFKTDVWRRNRGKMDYIDQGLQNTLAGAYDIADEFNKEIDVAKKYKSISYLSGIRFDRLKEPLAKSKQGLEEWLELNRGRKKPAEESSDSAS